MKTTTLRPRPISRGSFKYGEFKIDYSQYSEGIHIDYINDIDYLEYVALLKIFDNDDIIRLANEDARGDHYGH